MERLVHSEPLCGPVPTQTAGTHVRDLRDAERPSACLLAPGLMLTLHMCFHVPPPQGQGCFRPSASPRLPGVGISLPVNNQTSHSPFKKKMITSCRDKSQARSLLRGAITCGAGAGVPQLTGSGSRLSWARGREGRQAGWPHTMELALPPQLPRHLLWGNCCWDRAAGNRPGLILGCAGAFAELV